MEREREYTHPPGACILCHINYNSKLFKYVVTSHEKIVRENETEKEKDKGGEYLAWMHTGISDLTPNRSSFLAFLPQDTCAARAAAARLHMIDYQVLGTHPYTSCPPLMLHASYAAGHLH